MKTLTLALTLLGVSLFSLPAAARTVYVQGGGYYGNGCGTCYNPVRVVKVVKLYRVVRPATCCYTCRPRCGSCCGGFFGW